MSAGSVPSEASPWLGDGCLAVTSRGLPSVCVPSPSCKDTGQIGLGRTPVTSFCLNYLLKARSRNTVTFPGEFGSHGSRAAAVPSCSRWSSLATHRITPSPVRTSGAGEAREAGADEATRGAARCARWGGEARVLHPPDAGRETSPVYEEHGKEGLTAAELMREMEDEPFFKHR